MTERLARWRPAVVLALFLAGAVIAAPHALVSIVSRTAVLSYDNPASQFLDELTSEKAPRPDPLGEAADAVRAIASTSRRLVAGQRTCAPWPPALGCIEARAPPLA
jgi:hypothetical protein